MKEIPLTQGKVAYVDDEFYQPLRQRGVWHAERQGRTWYAARTETTPNGRKKTVYMHIAVWELGKCEPTREIDHRNHNGCDNQLANLRPANRRQQVQNCRKRQRTTSRFKGVSWHRGTSKWQTFIGRRYLGLRGDEHAAARLYDQAARELYGEFACLNFRESV